MKKSQTREVLGSAGKARRRTLAQVGAVAAGTLLGPAGCSPKDGSSGKAAPKTRRPSGAGPSGRMPVVYLPHGGGPCFFMKWRMGPPDLWDRMASYLKGLAQVPAARPKALVVVSAHWEAGVPTVIDSALPPLLYDYQGFPKHTYELTWPAPGEPKLARRVRELLGAAQIPSETTSQRGFDHGVFIPLKLAYPKADIPTVQLSLKRGLDPAEHLALGRALAPLRDEGVFLLGSGMSFHNLRFFADRSSGQQDSLRFDAWLAETVAAAPAERDRRLVQWAQAPGAHGSHPRQEHLLPLMVMAGAAGADRGKVAYSELLMGARVSAHQFG